MTRLAVEIAAVGLMRAGRKLTVILTDPLMITVHWALILVISCICYQQPIVIASCYHVLLLRVYNWHNNTAIYLTLATRLYNGVFDFDPLLA